MQMWVQLCCLKINKSPLKQNAGLVFNVMVCWSSEKNMMDIMSDDLVVKSNALIMATYTMTAEEQKVILSAIAQIRRDEIVTDAIMYTVTANALSDMGGFSAKNEYRNLAAAVERLFERKVVISSLNQDSVKIKTRWVQTCKYKQNEGCVELRFSKDILPYLNQLSEQFTQYKLQNISGMTSSYGIRLYELLIQWRSIGEREVELEWLRHMWNLGSKYQSICDLKKRVLDPAINDVNAHSDLHVTLGQRKTGRQVTHLQFKFEPKKKTERKTAKKLTDSEISARARPGESWDEARTRLTSTFS